MTGREKDNVVNEIVTKLQEVYCSEFFGNITELCQGEGMVLLLLNDDPQQIYNPAIISSRLEISRQRVTAVLSGLRKKGLITMELDKHDRRRMNVRITEDGVQYITAKTDKAEKYFDILIDKMGLDNIMNFVDLLSTAAKCIAEEDFKQVTR